MRLIEKSIRFFVAVLLVIGPLPYNPGVRCVFAQEVNSTFSLSLVGIREDNVSGLHFVFDGSKEVSVSSDKLATLLKNGPIKFFLIALSLPNDQMWVNLSPDLDETNILGNQLGKTDLGKKFLFYDLLLKKDAQQLMEELQDRFPLLDNLFNISSDVSIRFWIVPGRGMASVGNDFILLRKTPLDVRVEIRNKDGELRKKIEALIRKEVLPKLVAKINNSKEYLGLRVIHNSILLAQWYKSYKRDGMFSPLIDRGIPVGDLVSDKMWFRKWYLKKYLSMYYKHLLSNVGSMEYMVNMQLIVGGVDESNAFMELTLAHTSSMERLPTMGVARCSWNTRSSMSNGNMSNGGMSNGNMSGGNISDGDDNTDNVIDSTIDSILREVENEYAGENNDREIIKNNEKLEKVIKELGEFRKTIEKRVIDELGLEEKVGDLGHVTPYGNIEYFRVSGIGHVVKLPEGSDIMVASNLHGDFENFKKIVEEFRQRLKRKENPILVFLGDYLDKGPHSFAVLVGVLKLFQKFPNNVVVLRGDHESVRLWRVFEPLLLPALPGEEEEQMEKKQTIEKLFCSLPSIAICRCGERGKNLIFVHGGLPVRWTGEGNKHEPLSFEDLTWRELFGLRKGEVRKPAGLLKFLKRILGKGKKEQEPVFPDRVRRGTIPLFESAPTVEEDREGMPRKEFGNYFGERTVGEKNFVICGGGDDGYMGKRIARISSNGRGAIIAIVDTNKVRSANDIRDFVEIKRVEDIGREDVADFLFDEADNGREEDDIEDNDMEGSSKSKVLDWREHFEIGQKYWRYGHKIAGGKSVGRMSNREIIVVDWKRDVVLQQFYNKIKTKIEKDISGRYPILGEYKGAILNLIFDEVAKLPDEYSYLDEFRGKEFLVGKAIEKGGVCRHKSIIMAAIIERLLEEGVLDGKVFYVRGPGHGWVVYETNHGKLLLLDAAAQERILPLNEQQEYFFFPYDIKYVEHLPEELRQVYNANKDREFYPDEANPFKVRGGYIGKQMSYVGVMKKKDIIDWEGLFDTNVNLDDYSGVILLRDRNNRDNRISVPVKRYNSADVKTALGQLINSGSQLGKLLGEIWDELNLDDKFEFYSVFDNKNRELKDFLGYGTMTSEGKGLVFVSNSLLNSLNEEGRGLLFLHELFEALLEVGLISIKFNHNKKTLDVYVKGKLKHRFSIAKLSEKDFSKFALKLLNADALNHYLIYMLEQIDIPDISSELTEAIRGVLKERGYKAKNYPLNALSSSNIEVDKMQRKNSNLPKDVLLTIYDVFINGKKEGALPSILSDLNQITLHKDVAGKENISIDELLTQVRNSGVDKAEQIIDRVNAEKSDIYRALKLFALLDDIGMDILNPELYAKAKQLALSVFKANMNNSDILKKMLSVLSLADESDSVAREKKVDSVAKGGIVFSLNELSVDILV